MNKTAVVQQSKTKSFLPPTLGLLQSKCACGNHTVAGGDCTACMKNKSGLQRKLSIGASNDSLEQEADRIADRVLATPTNTNISTAPPRIQRFTGQTTGQADVAPASVDRVLSSPGRPLEASLQQEMGQRFGHDFSRVRVHTGVEAARSAQDVNASAYTVGHNVVFSAGQFAPQTNEGQRLIAHELTHVIQQSGAGVNHLAKNEIPNPAPVSYSTNSSSGLLLQRQSIGSARGVDEKGSMLWESFRQSINLDNFDSDKATLKPNHLSQIKNYKERFQLLLGRYPDSFISVIGHTDATDTEGHNNILGQERADTVKSELTSGDSALPVAIVHAGSLGKSNLAVETKGREARNRRVQIIPQLRNFSKLAVPEPSKPLPSLSSIGSGSSQEPTVGSGSLLLDSKKQIPDLKLPQQTWVQDALKKDPIVKSLPKWAQDKIIDAAKDGDEMLAEKIIDSLPLGDKKAAIQSIVKSILQMVKGKKFEVPIPPLHEIPPSTAPNFPKAPGEVIVPIPGLSGAF